jgi:hypothetical protein
MSNDAAATATTPTDRDVCGAKVRLTSGETGVVQSTYGAAGAVESFDLRTDKLNRHGSRVILLDLGLTDIADYLD